MEQANCALAFVDVLYLVYAICCYRYNVVTALNRAQGKTEHV